MKLVNLFAVDEWPLNRNVGLCEREAVHGGGGVESVELPFGVTIDRVVAGAKNGSRLPDYHRLAWRSIVRFRGVIVGEGSSI